MFAFWVAGKTGQRGTRRSKAPAKPAANVRFLEAVVEKPGSATLALELELPGGARLRINGPEMNKPPSGSIR